MKESLSQSHSMPTQFTFTIQLYPILALRVVYNFFMDHNIRKIFFFKACVLFIFVFWICVLFCQVKRRVCRRSDQCCVRCQVSESYPSCQTGWSGYWHDTLVEWVNGYDLVRLTSPSSPLTWLGGWYDPPHRCLVGLKARSCLFHHSGDVGRMMVPDRYHFLPHQSGGVIDTAVIPVNLVVSM